MKVKINQELEELNEMTINQLLDLKGLNNEGVVVLLNDEIIKKGNYDKIIKENDEIDLLSFVSGG